MKGLVYKEMYLARKGYILFFVLAFVFSLLGFLVFLSMICGNLEGLPEKDPQTVEILRTFFIYLPFVLSLFAVNGGNQSVYSDYASNWMTYSYTFPTRASKAIGARYLAGILLFPVCIIYGILNVLVISKISEYSLNAEIFKNMTVFFVFAVCIYALNVPMAIKYKTQHAVSTRWGIIFILTYLVIGFIEIQKGMLNEETDGNELLAESFERYQMIRDTLIPFVPIIILMVLAVSFCVSVKIYQRREGKC